MQSFSLQEVMLHVHTCITNSSHRPDANGKSSIRHTLTWIKAFARQTRPGALQRALHPREWVDGQQARVRLGRRRLLQRGLGPSTRSASASNVRTS
jgi:hypothetical protein